MTLVEVLLSLPAGTHLSMSEEFGRTVGTRMVYGTVSQAVAVVGQAGYGKKEAELNGRYVEVYSGGRWFPWRAFEVV
jgi:hypothetical protein